MTIILDDQRARMAVVIEDVRSGVFTTDFFRTLRALQPTDVRIARIRVSAYRLEAVQLAPSDESLREPRWPGPPSSYAGFVFDGTPRALASVEMAARRCKVEGTTYFPKGGPIFLNRRAEPRPKVVFYQ